MIGGKALSCLARFSIIPSTWWWWQENEYQLHHSLDHSILFSRLDDWFGVTGNALDWFISYLTGRCDTTHLGDLPSRINLPFGVPQGSVFGSLLFTFYTTQHSHINSGYAISHHLYADNSQLYVSSASSDSASTLSNLWLCLASAQSWMSMNKLKLNQTKQYSLLSGTNRRGAYI